MHRQNWDINPTIEQIPEWIPPAVCHYLIHTEQGASIRTVARRARCAASTILRQIRRLESDREDPLVDSALNRLRPYFHASREKDQTPMNVTAKPVASPDNSTLEREARRILRRLCETDAVLAISGDMPQAVVLKLQDGSPKRIAVVDRETAEAFVLKDWIRCRKSSRVMQYEITNAGRSALKRMIARTDAERLAGGPDKAFDPFSEQHRDTVERPDPARTAAPAMPARLRYNLAESPLSALARRKDKDGAPFLTEAMVIAGERLREDFELAQMGPRVAQNWERFLTGGDRSAFQPGGGSQGGSDRARDRVHRALSELGPGLGDVALRCCCFLEGLETAEKRMGWSARSGKIVLRIALQRLANHYEDVHGSGGDLIG